jgi:hypothetical protein
MEMVIIFNEYLLSLDVQLDLIQLCAHYAMLSSRNGHGRGGDHHLTILRFWENRRRRRLGEYQYDDRTHGSNA